MTTTGKSQFMRPRWKKVFSDLWGDKTRTLLVVSSVGVGVFAGCERTGLESGVGVGVFAGGERTGLEIPSG